MRVFTFELWGFSICLRICSISSKIRFNLARDFTEAPVRHLPGGVLTPFCRVFLKDKLS